MSGGVSAKTDALADKHIPGKWRSKQKQTESPQGCSESEGDSRGHSLCKDTKNRKQAEHYNVQSQRTVAHVHLFVLFIIILSMNVHFL